MPPLNCAGCGIVLSAEALACGGCGALVHAAELEVIAGKAITATAAGELALARDLWAKALVLLPEDTVQYRSIQAKIAELDAQLAQPGGDAAPGGEGQSKWAKRLAALGPIGLILWKFKFVLVFLLTKGKLLLLGLTKASTLLSMFAAVGVYWALYGWAFAIGIVVSIYIHEMGHVQALHRYGIPASAPMFIPGFGAFIRLKAMHLNPVEDARVGLAGPIYGLATALVALAVYAATQAKVWGAIAQFGAVINLFNLIPIWQLDGGRGFHSLTRKQRLIILITALVMWFITSEPMLFLILLGCIYRMFTKDAAATPDDTGLKQFAALLVALAAISVFAKSIAGEY